MPGIRLQRGSFSEDMPVDFGPVRGNPNGIPLRSQAGQKHDEPRKQLRRISETVPARAMKPCPACGGHALKPLFEKNGLSVDACRDCGTAFVPDPPSPEALKDYY